MALILPFPINANRTDAKSPINQDLFDDLRLNQEFLCDQLGALGGGVVFEFKVNGLLALSGVQDDIKLGRRYDSAFVPSAFSPARARMYMEVGATSGKLKADAHYNVELNHPIIKIDHQMDLLTQDIARAGAGFATQAIARATPQIATQAINTFHATKNIETISILPSGNILVTFAGTAILEEDEYLVGDLFEISGATAGANNGKFAIIGVNYDGLPSILYANGAAVEQTATAGTGRLFTFEYVFAGAVDDDFTEGETALFAGHTDANNDGNLIVWKINQAGNNIIVKATNINAVVQAGIAGTVDTHRWEYTFLAPVDADFLVGETVEFSGHTSGGNDGDFELKKKNVPANTVVIHNQVGVVQAGIAGTMDSNHWIYALPSDPTGEILVGENVEFATHTSALNDGEFTVLEINKNAVNNIVIYNPVGVAQVGVAGTTRHTRKIVTFTDDKSADFILDESFAALEGLVTPSDEDEYQVKEINRGTVLDFNIVIYAPFLTAQLTRSGRVSYNKVSLFATLPEIEFTSEKQRNLTADITNVLKGDPVPTNARLTMDILEVPESDLAENMTLSIE